MADEAKKIEIPKVRVIGTVKTKSVSSSGIAFRHANITTAPTVIAPDNEERNSLLIRNLGAQDVWIGDRGVIAGTNGNGFLLRQNETLTLTASVGEIWGVVAANTGTLAIIEE